MKNLKILQKFEGVVEAPNWVSGKVTAKEYLVYNKDGAIFRFDLETKTSTKIEGGEARLITPKAPSYLHGWSPDGKELAYCAFRTVDGNKDGKQSVDIYTIPASGGQEKRLTTEGFNDGPEYSPDGKHIWFISTRSGLMQLYRMNADGTNIKQMTFEDFNNWFGHVSPDCKKVVNLSYRKGDLQPGFNQRKFLVW